MKALRIEDFRTCDDDDVEWFVDFYAPWCPHCRVFAPIYDSDAEWFMSTYPSRHVRFGIVNCDRFGELCSEFKVTSYPTLKFFPSLCLDGKQVQYKNSRSKDDQRRRWYAERVGVTYSESLQISSSNLERVSLVPQVVVAKQDIAAAVFFSFKHNIFNGVQVLSSKDSNVLKSWLLLLEKSLDDVPTSESIASLRRTFFEFENSDVTFWNRIVARTYIYGFDSRISWTSTCSGIGHGYPCVLWQLFHFLALHSADSGLETLITIRNFVDRFFRCDACQQHFRLMSACLLDEDMPCGIDKLAFDSRAASMWLWSAHNNITARISSENSHTYTKSLYPSFSSCPACWNSETESWNENSVYAFLRTVYATPSSSSLTTLESAIVLERENFEYAVVSLVVVILALSAIIYAACKYLNEAKTLSRKHRFRRIQEPSSGTRNAAMLLSRRNLINNAYTGEENYFDDDDDGDGDLVGGGSRFLVHRVTSTV